VNRTALAAGIALFALGIALLFVYVRRFEAERGGGEHIEILVAAQKIGRGKTIADSLLTVRRVPVAYVEDRAIRESEREKLVGRRAIHVLAAGQALMWTDFVERAGEGRDLSSLVLPGYRAVHIRTLRDEQGAMLIRPGDYVDLIATLVDTENRKERRSVVLAQKALVLAKGAKTSAERALPDPDEKHSSAAPEDNGLTLSLSLQQAQAVAVAATRGTFAVALRNPAEERIFTAVPPIPGAALRDANARSAIQAGVYEPPGGTSEPVLGDALNAQ
jgi:pilus assembly protein CpaB